MLQKRLSLLSLLTIVSLLLAACVQPVPIAPAASGEAAPAASSSGDAAAAAAPATDKAVSGGTWTRASSADASILNPILASDSESAAINAQLFPGLIGQDPFTGATVPDGSMSKGWDVSEDGLIWTFHLREGVKWSDGEPVTSADFKFTYNAIGSDLVETSRKSLLEGIESIETPDPLTVVVKFSQVRCDGLTNLGIAWLPSHLYKADFTDIMENPLNEFPKASAGPLTFQSWTRDDNAILVRNESYWEGAPHMDGMIYRVVPDPAAQLAQLQSGEIDIMGLEPAQLDAVAGNPDIQVYNFKDDGYDFIGLNLADPNDPKPGRDEAGKLVEQTPHPILSDVKVRQAIAHSLDYQAIIDKVYLKQGYQIAANVLPAVSWAHDASIQPYTTDLEQAKALLEEAGWVDSNGDGVREKDGKPLELNLVTNAGNTVRADLGVLAQDQLNSVGFKITFETIDFGTLVDKLLGQTYDMVIIGWTGLGSDPNDDAFWSTKFDTPGSGFNFVSYQNPKIDDLLEQGVSVVGCKSEDRAPAYKQIQQIIHDDVPYVFISGGVGNTGYTTKWGNINPGEWSFYHNDQEWYQKSLQP